MMRLRFVLFLWVLGLLRVPAEAADIRTYPTRLTLTPGAAIGSIMVKNNDTTPTAMQIEVMSWAQKDGGEDVYEVTRDLLINPVIFELGPGAEQVVRIGLQGGAPADVERTYRVFMQQLPARTGAAETTGITTLLRIGIPIFIPPKQAVHDVQWAIRSGTDGKLHVEAVNKGTVHLQITSMDLLTASGAAVMKGNVFAYILPGQSRQWDITPLVGVKSGDQLRIEAVTDHEPLDANIVVQPTGR